MFDLTDSNRLSRILFVSQSFFSAAHISIITLTSIVSVELSGTEATAGMPSSVTTFAQAFAAYPVGLLMGRFGRRMGLSLGYSTSMIGAIIGFLAIISNSFPLLIVSAVLLGAGRSSADQSRYAAGEMYPPDQRARMIGRIVFAGTIGAVGGPSLVTPSTKLMEGLGLAPHAGPWAIAAFLFLAAALINFFLLRPDPMAIALIIEGESEKPKQENLVNGRSLRELFMLPSVQLATLGMLVSQTVMVVLMVMTPLHMHHHNHDASAVSLVISAHTLGMFALSGVTGYLIDRFGRIKMLVAGAGLLILSAILAPLSTELPLLLLALFLLGLGWNFGYVAGSSLLSDALQGAEKVRVQGTNDMLVQLMAGLGSLSSGPLFATGGYAAVSLAGLLITLFLVFMIFRLSPRKLKMKLA